MKEIKFKLNDKDYIRIKIIANFNNKELEQYIIQLINKDLIDIGMKDKIINNENFKLRNI